MHTIKVLNCCTFNATRDNGSFSEHTQKCLQCLNSEKAFLYIPVIIFVALIMIIGTFGNIMVIYVYNWGFKRRSANFFISAMAIFDLLGCLISMPAGVYDLINSYTFDDKIGCKIVKYTEAAIIYGSAIILIEIAFDRYFKICRPLRVLMTSKIKTMCWVACVAAFILASPALFLFGITKQSTPINGTFGYDCSIDEKYRGTAFPKVYYNMLTVVFVITFSLLAGFYIKIWIEIRQRRDCGVGTVYGSTRIKNAVKLARSKNTIFARSTSSESKDTTPKSPKSPKKVTDAISPDIDNSPPSSPPKILSQPKTIKLSRTTIIFFTVTVAFVVTYLPGLIIMITRSVVTNFYEDLSPIEEMIVKLFSRFYFINNAINPIIYSFLNSRFRKQCSKVFISIALCCKNVMKNKDDISSHDYSRSYTY